MSSLWHKLAPDTNTLWTGQPDNTALRGFVLSLDPAAAMKIPCVAILPPTASLREHSLTVGYTTAPQPTAAVPPAPLPAAASPPARTLLPAAAAPPAWPLGRLLATVRPVPPPVASLPLVPLPSPGEEASNSDCWFSTFHKSYLNILSLQFQHFIREMLNMLYENVAQALRKYWTYFEKILLTKMCKT